MILSAEQTVNVERAVDTICCEIAIQCVHFRSMEEAEEFMRRLVVITGKNRVRIAEAKPKYGCPIDGHANDCDCHGAGGGR